MDSQSSETDAQLLQKVKDWETLQLKSKSNKNHMLDADEHMKAYAGEFQKLCQTVREKNLS